jgi:hypothetical protein
MPQTGSMAMKDSSNQLSAISHQLRIFMLTADS